MDEFIVYTIHRRQRSGTVIYVGMTSDIKRRIEQHRNSGPIRAWMQKNPGVRLFVKGKRVTGKRNASELEKRLIKEHASCALLNYAHNKARQDKLRWQAYWASKEENSTRRSG